MHSGEELAMADFDPFENQGGGSALDPDQAAEIKKLAEKFLEDLKDLDDEPGSGPANFSGSESTDDLS